MATGGEQYRKAVEDAVLFSSVGVEGSAILADFSEEICRAFEAETVPERYAANQLFIMHIAFRKAEEKWKNNPERMIAEKYAIMQKIGELMQSQERSVKGTTI